MTEKQRLQKFYDFKKEYLGRITKSESFIDSRSYFNQLYGVIEFVYQIELINFEQCDRFRKEAIRAYMPIMKKYNKGNKKK